MRPAAAALLIALAAATPATGFVAQNGLVVEPAGDAGFTVRWRGRSGATDFWCAAGDYAARRLHLAPTAMIWRASEPPRRGGEGIDFTLRREAAASRSGLMTLGGSGAGLTVAAAQAFCENRRSRR